MTAPIVLLHGWGLRPEVWAGLRAELGVPTLALDVLPDEGSLHDWAGQLLDKVPNGAILIGWSLGAMLAMAIAARVPQHVSRLVLIAATPSFVKREGWEHALDAETTMAFRENFLRAPDRTLERFIALQVLGDAKRSTVIGTLRDNLADIATCSIPLGHGLRLLQESDLRAALPPESLRCLLIHGEQDALMPPSATAWLAHRWPASETFIMPDTGHAPFLSQPQVVAARIRQFIHAH